MFKFTDRAENTLTLVILTAGRTLRCAALGRETPFAVLVEHDGDAQLFDLDGDTVSPGYAGCEDCEPATTAPGDVLRVTLPAEHFTRGKLRTAMARLVPTSSVQLNNYVSAIVEVVSG